MENSISYRTVNNLNKYECNNNVDFNKFTNSLFNKLMNNGHRCHQCIGFDLGFFNKQIQGCSPLFAETGAVYFALQWAWGHRWQNIVIESDSLLGTKYAKCKPQE